MTQHAPGPRPAPSSNTPPWCGLWSGPRRSAAVLLDPVSQRQLALSLANTEQARATLLDWLADQSAHLVAIRFTTGLTTRAPKHTAALLARWPTAPALRPFLRRLNAPRPPDQLSLL